MGGRPLTFIRPNMYDCRQNAGLSEETSAQDDISDRRLQIKRVRKNAVQVRS
jgi:hypothetical protein